MAPSLSKAARSSTRDLPEAGFKSHGTMDLEFDGWVNVMEAHGPFNLELVVAAERAQAQLDPGIPADQRWGSMLVFKNSALASPEALKEIARIVQERVQRGLRPVGVALVFGPDVEGRLLMQGHFTKAYSDAGLVTQCFADQDTARAWLRGRIDGPDSPD